MLFHLPTSFREVLNSRPRAETDNRSSKGGNRVQKPSAVPALNELSIADAVEIVTGSDNPPLLRAWLAVEQRQEVRSALEARLTEVRKHVD